MIYTIKWYASDAGRGRIMIRIEDGFTNKLNGFNFVDLFCGIGGFHLALKSFGAKCVFASDIDAGACNIYDRNFGLKPAGDIVSIKAEQIPKHDILCGGFPCQSFSVSGKGEGFEDKRNGGLFFEIIKIAKIHKPKIIFLENVANLEKHDGGKSIKRIEAELRAINYEPVYKVLNAIDFGIPQVRKRLYIVAIRSDIKKGDFIFPSPRILNTNLEALLENNVSENYNVNKEYILRDQWATIAEKTKKPYIRIGEIGKGRQGERIYSPKGCAVTLSSSGGGIGGRTGMYLIRGKNRVLTPRECARLMGFPDHFQIADTKHQSHKQFGNSVVVDVLQEIIKQIIIYVNKGE